MKKIAYITLGCKLNYAETSTYERELGKKGFEAVPWNKGADVFLVNTCTVTEHSDKKSRNIIRKLHRTYLRDRMFRTAAPGRHRENRRGGTRIRSHRKEPCSADYP